MTSRESTGFKSGEGLPRDAQRGNRGGTILKQNPKLPMKTNVGSYDAGVRFLIGCAVLFMSVNGLGWWALLGLVPMLTAACSFCPLYLLFHLDTEAWERAYEARHRQHPPKQF